MMNDTELKTFVEDLSGWYDGRKENLQEVLKNIEGKEKLTLDFGDDLQIKLKNKQEINAYRMGIISAISAFGDFPVSIENK